MKGELPRDRVRWSPGGWKTDKNFLAKIICNFLCAVQNSHFGCAYRIFFFVKTVFLMLCSLSLPKGHCSINYHLQALFLHCLLPSTPVSAILRSPPTRWIGTVILENNLANLAKEKVCTLFDPEISLLENLYLDMLMQIHKDKHTKMLIAAPLVGAKAERPEQPSVGDWLSKSHTRKRRWYKVKWKKKKTCRAMWPS